jgi:hypothetical protein
MEIEMEIEMAHTQRLTVYWQTPIGRGSPWHVYPAEHVRGDDATPVRIVTLLLPDEALVVPMRTAAQGYPEHDAARAAYARTRDPELIWSQGYELQWAGAGAYVEVPEETPERAYVLVRAWDGARMPLSLIEEES